MSSSKNYLVSITIIGILFFIFGFITWINGTLIPYLKIACELKTDVQSYLVATAFLNGIQEGNGHWPFYNVDWRSCFYTSSQWSRF